MSLKNLLSKLRYVASVFVVASIGLFFICTHSVHAAPSVQIMGTVTYDGNDSNIPIANAQVTASAPGDNAPLFGPITTDQNGYFDLMVEPGTYDLHFTPPSGSTAQSSIQSSVNATQDTYVTASLSRPTRTFAGTLIDGQGNPYSNVTVEISEILPGKNYYGGEGAGVKTDAQGHFSMTAPAAQYSLGFVSDNAASGFSVDYSDTQDGYPMPTINLTNGDDTNHTINFPTQTSLDITVKDAQGQPVPNQTVTYEGFVDHLPWANGFSNGHEYGSPKTDANGVAHVVLIATTQIAAGSLCTTQDNTRTVVCNTSPISIGSTPASTELKLPVVRTITGTLLNSNGQAQSNTTVKLLPTDPGSPAPDPVTTDANGHFTFAIGATTFKLEYDIKGSGNSGIYLTTNTIFDTTAQDITVTQTLPHMSSVGINSNPNVLAYSSLHAVQSDNTAIQGGTDTYTAEVFVSQYSQAAATEAPDGTVFAANSICVWFNSFNPASLKICNKDPVTVNGATTITLTKPADRTLSGVITHADGTPAVGVQPYLINVGNEYQTSAITNSQGAYSIATVALPFDQFSINGALPLDTTYVFDEQLVLPTVDLTSGDLVKNYQLPAIRYATITIKDENGNPESNVPISFFAAPPGVVQDGVSYNGVSHMLGGGMLSDENGQVSLPVFDGFAFETNSWDQGLCASFPDGTTACNTSTIVMDGNKNITLQHPAPPVTTPTNLHAASPTNTMPALQWNAVAHAVSYDVYRDGNKIASTTTTSYTDTTATEARHAYFVTAVNSSGAASDPSTTINVVYDKTAPTISIVVTPTPTNGWNKDNATVTFTCNDNLSGVANCPAPVTVSTETSGQSISGTATDVAGNAASASIIVKLDKTSPTVTSPRVTPAFILNSGTLSITATAADTLSGVANGEYCIDTDLGPGNCRNMTYANGRINANTTYSGPQNGTHTVYIRSHDAAGNWSSTTTRTFTYLKLF